MVARIKFIRSVEYLVSSPEGDVDLDESKRLLADLAKAKRPPANYDIILDFRRAQINLSTTDIWYLAADLPNHENTFRDKVAVLILPGLDFDKAKFFELCSENRGFNIEVFTNYEDAVDWFYGTAS